MWRWIDQVKKGQSVSGSEPPSQSAPEKAERAVLETIFFPPTRNPFLPYMQELFEDADLLRASSLASDGSIRNSRTFERSAKLRFDVFSRLFRVKGILEYEEMLFRIFEDTLMEVHAEDVGASHRILNRLRALGERLAATEQV
jgi:hypothetical protein